MVRRTTLDFNRPKLFTPGTTRRMLEGTGAVIQKNAQDLVESNIVSTSSFRYDPDGTGIKSTQQIPVDFSRFETHTFFNSAEVNVNVAFDRIINEFPFDGTKREIEAFLDSLTGFENWVFNRFPRNLGYLYFSGSSSPAATEGTYITVRDFAGNQYPNISKKRTGENVLDPGFNSFTVELQLFVPEQTNGNQVICQKLSGSNQGITLALSQSQSTLSCSVVFAVSSGALILSASSVIEKGQFNHVVACLDRHPGVNNVQIFVNEELTAESTTVVEMGQIGFQFSPLYIGSGSTHDRMHCSSPSVSFVPNQTLSGAIDEFRIFHTTRTVKEQKLYARKAIFPNSDLKLYFKFNEPTGSIGMDSLVIDSSGNSLHSLISNFSYALRSTGSLDGPLTYEKRSLHPVLFPLYREVQDLNEELLASGSEYDAANPNLITKLIPDHYLQEGQVFEGLQDEEGTINDALDGGGAPRTAELGSVQLLASMLYVWAKFFDEIKMMIDQFGSVIHVDYDKQGFSADQFLQFVAKYYGFEMPAFFIDSSIEQFIDSENISDQIGTNSLSLQYVQNQLWRRILTNLGDVIRSKGTLHSIKALLRSMGIEPDRNFKIREYGGPTFQNLADARDNITDVISMVDFSGSLATVSSTLDSHGVPNNKPYLRSAFLSGSRVEPGFPALSGSFIPQPGGAVISNNRSDGLFTSGSWTYEGLYKFPRLLTGSHAVTQSLVRMFGTGSFATHAGAGALYANLIAVSGSHLTLYASTDHPMLELPLTGVDIFDGRLWNVSFGRQCATEIGSYLSASYFLRAARQEFGSIIESYATSTVFMEYDAGSSSDFFSVYVDAGTTYNISGAFIAIGSQSVNVAADAYLNNIDNEAGARETMFSGRVGQIRFWTKALTTDEWDEHVLNPRSLGVYDPKINFNFVNKVTGSWERLRIDASAEQPITESNVDGTFLLFDFSQNNFHVSGTGFEASTQVVVPERAFYSQLSPRFDEAASNNKVRVRSFKDFANVSRFGGEVAPIYEIPRSEQPMDDLRFSIDFSIMDALDEDIVKIFASLDEFDNAIGSPELIFSPDYPSLEDLRDVYFRRLTNRVKLRQFFEFFKWFDSILGISTFIEQLLPRKTMFLGTNFVIESHMLERPRVEYLYSDMYLGENDRHGLKGTILLQQFAGSLKRF